VRFDFHTDSSSLVFAAASPGKYEVYIDGQLRHLLLIGPAEKGGKYGVGEEITLQLCDPLGNKNAEHRVTLYLPSHSIGGISLLALDDGAYVKRHEFSVKFLMIGDSITQGYDALRPSSIYSSKLCKLLGAEEINKAIGGEGFAPSLAELASEKDVDYVTIAYGTNDFTAGRPLEGDGKYDIKAFGGALRYSVEKIAKAFPHIKIAVCSQTYRFWRKDGVAVSDSNTRVEKGNKLTDFVKKTEEIAKEYGLFYIDNYYGPVINESNRDICFSETDETHPLVPGLKLIAENIARELTEKFGE
jgi:lysophospholipase L1-like esterase